MIHIKNHMPLLLLFFFSLTFTSNPRAETIYTIGGVSTVFPMTYEENGRAEGFYPDLFREIAKRANLKIKFELYPFKRVNAGLKKGTIDLVITIFYKKERESYLVYTSKPVLISRTRVFVKAGKEFPFQTVEDLVGKQIGVLSGWSVNNALYEQAKADGRIFFQEVAHTEQNLKKLMSGRIDCSIMTEQLTWYYVNKLRWSRQIVALEKPIAANLTYMAASKKSKNFADPHLFMAKIDAIFNEIMEDGTYLQIQTLHGITTLRMPDEP